MAQGNKLFVRLEVWDLIDLRTLGKIGGPVSTIVPVKSPIQPTENFSEINKFWSFSTLGDANFTTQVPKSQLKIEKYFFVTVLCLSACCTL